ncbi:MAG: 50S ribosomal protein L15e [Candidatus Lokiarchaeota archaeon]|nr:50S ribosomal protein L15e [Candidatus Lokiarchaeota archaeon]
MKSGYKYLKETFEKNEKGYKTPHWYRGIQFRKGHSIERIDRPTKLHRARSLGYKAKQGYIIVRARIRKGGMHKIRPKRGRKPRALGVSKYTTGKNLQWIAEERAQKKYANMQVLNSYKVLDDGKHWYYEVILVDPNHPVIKSDPQINWIHSSANTKRVTRGLSSAGKRARGLRKKGWGSEKTRPSIRANKGRGK